MEERVEKRKEWLCPIKRKPNIDITDHFVQKKRYVVMKTPNAIINTTCRGTPSGDTTWSSIMVPISVPVVLPSSDRARFLRLKPVASVGAELGSGAVASRARKR